MRTNINIDDKLLSDALQATGLTTKREVVELGLRTLLRLRQQEEIRRYRGKLDREGEMGRTRVEVSPFVLIQESAGGSKET